MTTPEDTPESDPVDDSAQSASNTDDSALIPPAHEDRPEWVSDSEHIIRPTPESEDAESQYSLKNPPAEWESDVPDWHRVKKVTTPPVSASTRPKRKRSSRAALMGCNLLVFLASVCVMVLELSASRIISKHVGNSLYTWTSVIGVVLAGITVGNFIGGWLADRFIKEKLLSKLFLLSSVTCLSVLWLDRLVAGRPRPADIDWPTWVFIIVAEMFFAPALALGMISPVVASIALEKSHRTGITVGNVYAWSALGSIVGTFLTGFWLIDTFGTRMIIGGTAATLAILGIAVATRQRLFRTAVICGWLQFLLVTTSAAAATSDSLGEFGETLGKLIGKRDQSVVALRNWYEDSVTIQLDAQTRSDLQQRLQKKLVPQLDEKQHSAFHEWLGSGNRKHFTPESEAALQIVIDDGTVERSTLRLWRDQGEQIGRALHELGLLLFLRDDLTGEYHDESNYSYINVSADFDEDSGQPIRQLRLDKLVHSYFNPAQPTELYYEYEQIYAEITERVSGGFTRGTAVVVEPFPEFEQIAQRLPEWAIIDADRNELTIQGVLTESRRQELLRASIHGDIWLAIEELAASTRAPDWGGFSSVAIDQIPQGATQESFFTNHLTFESAFKSLNAFHRLSDKDIEKLCAAGEARDSVEWRSVVDSLALDSRRISTFFIGGGGFVFPRWIEHTYSDQSRIDVAELDPAVKYAVQREMGLPADDQTAIRTWIGDARNVIDDLLRENSEVATESKIAYDFIYGDAFNDFSVPYHLTTVEFVKKVRRLLSPESGVYMINVIDAWPRTRFPPGNDDDRTSRNLVDGFPAGLIIEPDQYAEWEFAPEPLGGMELLANEDGSQRFAVRGVMPESLLQRIHQVSNNADMAEFRVGMEQLHLRSQKTVGGRFMSSCANTLCQVFPNVYIFSTSHGTPSEFRDTFVLVASLAPIDLTDLDRSGIHWNAAPFAIYEKSDDSDPKMTGQMESIIATSRGLILTDDYAPVDNLLRPVFESQE